MAYLSWIKVGGVSETRSKNEAKEDVHNALVRMTSVVGAMGRSDPGSPDWRKLCGDFGKAVKGMDSAIRRYDREWRKGGPDR